VRGAGRRVPLPAPARIPLSHHFFHDPVPSSSSLSLAARAQSLSVSAGAGQHSAGARETGEKEEKERSSRAAAFPDRLLLRADSGAGLFQPWFSEPGGILALPEKDHIRQRFVSSLLSLFLCIRLFQLVVAEEGVSILMFFRGQDRGPSVPCVHRSSPEFSRAPSASGFIASIDSSSKYREIFTRRLVAFLSPSALFMLPLLVLDDCL